MEGVYENTDVTELTMRRIRYSKRKDLSTYLMFAMQDKPEEGWDSDLVADVMKQMDYEEYQQ